MRVSEIRVSYFNKNKDVVKVNCSEDAYKIGLSHWNLDTIELQEETKVLLLNRSNTVTGIYELSKGGITGCVVDIKLILSVALKAVASSIIIIDNHPSGNLKPSEADKSLTERLNKACQVIDLVLLDHLIITKDSYLSFKNDGLF